MPLSLAPLQAIKEWRRKSSDVYNSSNDAFHSLMTRSLETMELLHSQTPNPILIQRALANLESERKTSLRFEDSNADDSRFVAFGFIESLHFTLHHLTEKFESSQDHNESVLSPKIAELQEHVRKLESINQDTSRAAREAQLRAENAESILASKRELIDGAEKRKKVLEEMTKKFAESSSQLEESNRKTENALTMINELMQEKEALKTENAKMRSELPIVGGGNLREDNTLNEREGEAQYVSPIEDSMDALSTEPMCTKSFPLKPKEEQVELEEEPIDISPLLPLGDTQPLIDSSLLINGPNGMVKVEDDSVSQLLFYPVNDPIEREEEKGNDINRNGDPLKLIRTNLVLYSFQRNELDRLKQLQDQTSMPVEETEMMPHSDLIGEAMPLMEQGSSETAEAKKRRRSSKTSKPVNSTKSTEDSDENAGPSVKKARSESKKDSDIKRRSNKGEPELASKTPQCVMCEKYPTSTRGYADHLRYQHKSTLKKTGIFLICSCGVEDLSGRSDLKHGNGCDRRRFSLHKLNKK
ncbi:hypothetical protein PENTCL1PPCAC_5596 [Pristionchus entomophagus]|uniref:Uncharacterized protein n=1 Tax=Pristionchus entomophagus TaxID=358040 RepID=A0AAV5SV76_9BILA|nr:hypothetical protein PENTCL1PPCAC_5596 [Pristionchus entomophagus]